MTRPNPTVEAWHRALPVRPRYALMAMNVKGASMVEQQLKIGDLVRRDPGDVWRIISIPLDYDPTKDRAECLCERPPLGWLQADGKRGTPWAKQGRTDRFDISDLKRLDADTLDQPVG